MKLHQKSFKHWALLGGLVLLTACGHDENPILKSELAVQMTETYVNRETVAVNRKPCIQGSCKVPEKSAFGREIAIKTKNNLQCPYYFAEPTQHADLKTTCEAWMNDNIIQEYQHWWPNYAKDKELQPATITNEELKDPALWTIITTAMNNVKKAHGVTP